ncbi:hypothetical protein [Streptomyces cyaneofuscatus]|uniref:hypothetical protein n=1 Tax=Streptomyces cyaneofuscatus TaxID=66883 RepID=UPI0036918F15
MAAGVVLAVALLWARRAAPGPQVSLPRAARSGRIGARTVTGRCPMDRVASVEGAGSG